MKRIYLMMILITSFLVSNIVFAQETIQFKEIGIKDIVKESKEQKKFAFIYFTNPGCVPCKLMEKTVYTNPAVYSLFNNDFINIKADCRDEKPLALELQERYKVVAFPTLLFIDSLGQIIHKKVGFADEKKMIELIQQTKGSENLANWQRRYNNGELNIHLVEKLLEYNDKPIVFMEENYECPAQKILDTYFASLKTNEFSEKRNWDLIKRYVSNPNSFVFKYLAENQHEFIKNFGEREVDTKIYETYLDYVSGNTSSDRWKNAMQSLQQSKIKQARAVIEYRRLQSEYSNLSKEKKWQQFVKQADPFISDNFYLMNKYQLNTWINGVLIGEAKNKMILQIMNRWMEKLFSDPNIDDYDLFVTHAEIYFKLGKKDLAKKTLVSGIEMARKTGADAEELKTLEKKLASYW